MEAIKYNIWRFRHWLSQLILPDTEAVKALKKWEATGHLFLRIYDGHDTVIKKNTQHEFSCVFEKCRDGFTDHVSELCGITDFMKKISKSSDFAGRVISFPIKFRD